MNVDQIYRFQRDEAFAKQFTILARQKIRAFLSQYLGL
jgi:hypothetical protein